MRDQERTARPTKLGIGVGATTVRRILAKGASVPRLDGMGLYERPGVDPGLIPPRAQTGGSLPDVMHGYYAQRLAAEALKGCYDLAPARVQRYLRAEVDFVVGRLHTTDVVLDLGCGYGRTIPDFARAAAFVVGVDSSRASLRMARELRAAPNSAVACMDAKRLGFAADSFDRVVCIQNGISAFHIDQRGLVREALRVLRPERWAIFSTYSDKFWEHRLDWFERQAAAGLLGEIDRERTRDGRIVCKDGFTSETVRPGEFRALVANLDVEVESVEVDESSRFYIVKKARRTREPPHRV